MNDNKLFRPEAVKAVQTSYLGNVVVARPVSLKIVSIIAAVFLIASIVFISLGSYTKRTQVFGQLLPKSGLIKLVAPQSGIVIEKYVTEGEKVEKGQVLYTLSSELLSRSLGNTQNLIIDQLRSRKKSLETELRATESVQADEEIAVRGKVSYLERAVSELELQFGVQQERLFIAQDISKRYAELLKKEYITKDQYLEKKVDYLDQVLNLKNLKRELASVNEDLAAKRIEYRSLAQKNVSVIAQIKRGLLSVEQELTETEAKRQIVIIAPETGVATGVLAQVGQRVEPSMPLLSIVPWESNLVANLYAPSKTVGFIAVGSPVLLRYTAYPYQKFGQYAGTVSSVSETSLSIQELSTLSGGKIPGIELASTEELYYRIVVQLDTQHVNAYGSLQRLKAGMVLEANIVQENRKLYEWILDPLYSLRGNLQP